MGIWFALAFATRAFKCVILSVSLELFHYSKDSENARAEQYTQSAAALLENFHRSCSESYTQQDKSA
jgi:hypothetical protein